MQRGQGKTATRIFESLPKKPWMKIKQAESPHSLAWIKRTSSSRTLTSPQPMTTPMRWGPEPLPSLLPLPAPPSVQTVPATDLGRPHGEVIAERSLQSEIASKRQKFRPGMVVQQAMMEDPSHTRKALGRSVPGKQCPGYCTPFQSIEQLARDVYVSRQ